MPITLLDQDTIKVIHFDVPLEQIFMSLDERTEPRGVLKEFLQFGFKKLDIYKNV
jgi:hypothetical protein